MGEYKSDVCAGGAPLPLHDDVLRRLEALETKVGELTEKAEYGALCDAETKIYIKQLGRDFESLKADVINTVKNHTDNTWELINKGVLLIKGGAKVIIGLVILIALIAGFKIAPDIIKILF